MSEAVFDFVGRRKIWYILSLLIIVPGLLSLMFRGLNLGIDFTGGSLLHLQFDKPPAVQEIRSVLDKFDLGSSAYIQTSENTVNIRTKPMDEATRDQVIAAIDQQVGKSTLLRDEMVGPIMGKELGQKALIAIAIASVMIVAYVTFRFEFLFAIAAIVALLHDIFVTLGVFSILQLEVDSSFVAAMLTVLGYSINDTIVIFDRIRENLQGKKKDIENLVNQSIVQTMTRSINTVLTVVFVLVALILFGGETTRTFSLAILIGVLAGAYSSIFNASPLWVDLRYAFKKNRRQKSKTA